MKVTTRTKPAPRRRAHAGRHLDEAFVDFFAGGGGASEGIERATGRPVTTAINHDANAIRMHATNHPHTHHVREDVWRADLIDAAAGRRVGGAWFSPDCRHFSRAKGKTPVKKNIRGLAWVVVKAAKVLRPKRIFLENVREFEAWGPLEHVRGTEPTRHEILTSTLTGRDLAKFNRGFKYDKNGHPVMMPIKGREGETFRRWVRELRALGYAVEWRILNAADYGAPTHRRRLFLVARCDGKAIRWPAATHGPKGTRPYRTAAECIDFGLPCPSVLLTKREAAAFAKRTRIRCKRPLAKKTRWRTAMGVKRFVLENPKPFIVRVNHGGQEFRGQSIDEPLATVTGRHGYGLVSAVTVGTGGAAYSAKPRPVDAPGGSVLPNDRRAAGVAFLKAFHHAKGKESRCNPVDRPINTLDTSNRYGLVMANVVRIGQSGSSGQNVADVRQPLTTITSKKEHCVITAACVAKHYGGVVGHGVDRPLGTVTATDHHSLVSATIVGVGGRAGQSPPTAVNAPLGTTTSKADRALVAANLIRMNFGDKQWNGADEPVSTITAQGKKHGVVLSTLVKYYGTAVGAPVDEPLHTTTSKPRFALVQATTAPGGWFLTDEELRRARKLAKWMRREIGRDLDKHLLTVRDEEKGETFQLLVAVVDGEPHIVTDIGLRMFTPRELARCQGFPEDYVLTGSQASQVARIGNSVPPDVVEALVNANWN